MAGKIKRKIDEIIVAVAKDNQTLKNITKTKLVLKGLNPDRFDAQSPDDPVILEKLKLFAIEFGVKTEIN
jgi:hypothetical protein